MRNSLFLGAVLAAAVALPAMAQPLGAPTAPAAPAGFPPGAGILPAIPSPSASTMPGMMPGMMPQTGQPGAPMATTGSMTDTSGSAYSGYQSPTSGSSFGAAGSMTNNSAPAYSGNPAAAPGASPGGAGSMAAYGGDPSMNYPR
jgi:hypothetical protein